MAKPIRATPTLKGEDAAKFIKEMLNVERGQITPQQKETASRIKANADKYTKLMGAISIA